MGFLASLQQSVSEHKKPVATFHSEFQLGQQLGEGGFAQVYSCGAKKKDIDDSERRAVKIFDTKNDTRGLRKDFRTEVLIMKQVGSHPFCVGFIDVFEDKRFCYIVMEKCSYNILDAFIGQEAATECEIAQVFNCVLKAIDYLHSVRIVHRDIKPCNMLLEDERGENCKVKLCDFGLAAQLPQPGSKCFGCIPKNCGLTEICGTTPYMAPEMLQQKRMYCELVDLWSCGVSMYLLLFGEFPYKAYRKDAEMLRDAILANRVKPSFKARRKLPQPSDDACELVAALMTRDPKSRPSAVQALSYLFLESYMPKAPATTPKDIQFVVAPLLCSESPTAELTQEFRTLGRLPSFHATLLEAKGAAQEHEPEGTPLVKRRSLEEALEKLQKKHKQQWQRNAWRCVSEPSMRCDIEVHRLLTRHTTHSGSIKPEDDFSLPGTPSTGAPTTDGGSDF